MTARRLAPGGALLLLALAYRRAHPAGAEGPARRARPPTACSSPSNGAPSGPSAADARWRPPASWATRRPTTWAPPAAASGRPRTWASPGAISPTATSRPAPWAPSRCAESDPNVVYVGMGEHAIRGVMTSSGDGVYRSTDAGRPGRRSASTRPGTSRASSWIPEPGRGLVAAQGALYAPSKQRGVFKSTDGGATWKNTLFVDEKTGAAELSMDAPEPAHPLRRDVGARPAALEVISGGPGSGLYKSTDGGDTWEKMTEGLPDKMGKMAIAVSRSNPDKVYALIESDSYSPARGLYAVRRRRPELEPGDQRAAPAAACLVLHRAVH